MKFGVVFLVLGLSIGGLGFAATTLLTDNVEASALEERQNAAYQEGTAMETWLEQNRNVVQAASDAPVVDTNDPEAIRSYLEETYYDMPESRMNGLYVNTTTGEVVTGVGGDADSLETLAFPDADELDSDLSTDTVAQTDPYSMPDQLGLSADSHPVVSYYIGVNNGEHALVFTFGLTDRSTGMITTADSDTVMTILDEQGRIVNDDAYMGNGDGENATFLTTYEDQSGVLETVQSENRGSLLVNEPPGETLRSAPYNFDPDGYVVGYYTTASDWTVLVHTTEAEALGFAHSATQFGLLITFVGVALIGVFGVVLGRTTARSLSDLSDRAAAIRDGEFDTTVESDRIDEIGTLYESIDDMRLSLVDQIEESDQARARAEQAREDSEQARAQADAARKEAEEAKERAERARRDAQEMTDHLERTATEYCDVMRDCAGGDLTRRLDPDTESDPMAEIATTFNEMLDDIERTVATVSAFATDVSDASDDVQARAAELEASSETVSDSVQQITGYADRQNERMETISGEVQGISANIEEIAATADSLAETSQHAAERANDGREAAGDVVDEMEDIEHRTESTLRAIRELDDSMAEIDEIIDVITDIADQTNILALNASIEAAHANNGDGNGGRNGNGFAVVANEVKQLAEETKDSAAEINQLIDTVQSQTNDTVAEMEAMREHVADGTETVEQSAAAFREIEAEVTEADHGVQEISDATDGIANSTQELVTMVDDVTEISTETASEASAVAGAVEEQTAAITTVSQNADALSEQSVTLQESVAAFTTDREATRAANADDHETTEATELQYVDERKADDASSAPKADSETGDETDAANARDGVEAAGETPPAIADPDATSDDPVGEDWAADDEETASGDVADETGTDR
ncbi:methyl-accepting chemotaxis protein [Natrialba asiatica]|uniref:Methyl-accepting chemotaxis sensory transducer n=1 Tax=Natrialba asiatica (strain ATCC 700177 / DSM 12278 / JCM 9576 / FERM P-10747 / NBRC 102637 / 172P1) TaxID=29540 RepID=M0AXK9_NATA1|nr:methyl-accepting chemotaxis sensory transducer [Natrialba asiatica DSM 12278]